MNFFGHSYNTATYIVDHPIFGWQSFGGNTTVSDNTVIVSPLDTYRIRVYIAARGLWLTLDSGNFKTIKIDTRSHDIAIGFDASSKWTNEALLRIEQPANISGVGTYHPVEGYAKERGGYIISLGKAETWLHLSDKQ
jgi:hypothetical protein